MFRQTGSLKVKRTSVFQEIRFGVSPIQRCSVSVPCWAWKGPIILRHENFFYERVEEKPCALHLGEETESVLCGVARIREDEQQVKAGAILLRLERA